MEKPPSQKPYKELKRKHPEFMEALETMGEAARKAGPLDSRTVSLVKLAYGIAAGLEGATHSQAARALEAGCTRDELLQVALLGATTIGFPTMVRGRCWVQEAIPKKPQAKKASRKKRSKR